MKVKLTGINYTSLDETDRHYINLLKQVPFPIEVKAGDEYPFTVILKRYITDPDYPRSAEEWGLDWFEYEEIED